MTSSIRSVASVLLAAFAMACAGRAHAEEPAHLAAARVAVEAAQKAYDLGRFEDAAIAYNSAWELSGLPEVLFNLAQCHRQLNQFERAAYYYQRYLEISPGPVENEALTRNLLAEMEEAAKKQPPPQPESAVALLPVPFLLELVAVPAQALPAAPVAPGARAEPDLSEDVRAEPAAPLVKQWWLWTLVGAVVTGGAIAAGVLASQGPAAPAPTLADIRF